MKSIKAKQNVYFFIYSCLKFLLHDSKITNYESLKLQEFLEKVS